MNARVEVPLLRVRQGPRVEFEGAPEGPYPPPYRARAGARALALAHRLRRALESGEVEDVGDLAARMKVSHPRVSMLLALTFLAPDLQDRLLRGGKEAGRLNFHQLLKVARMPLWEDQRRAWEGLQGDYSVYLRIRA